MRKSFKKTLSFVLASAMILTSANLGGTSADAAASVALNKTKATIKVKKTVTLKVTKVDGVKIQSKTWKSSDKKIATVTTAGKVKGKAAGKATISCVVKFTKEGKEKVYKKTLKSKITVKEAATPAESETPAESTTPAESETPAESTAPAESETPAESTAPAESEAPTESAAPTDSAAPADSAAPSASADASASPASTKIPATAAPSGTPAVKDISSLSASASPAASASVAPDKALAANTATMSPITVSTGSAITSNSLTLNFEAVATPDVAEFAIATKNGTAVSSYTWKAATAGATSYVFTGLDAGTKYTFVGRIKAGTKAASAISGLSNEVATLATVPTLTEANIASLTEEGTITFKDINALVNGKALQINAVGTGSAIVTKDVVAGGAEFTGLNSGVEYTFYLTVANDNTHYGNLKVKTFEEIKVVGDAPYIDSAIYESVASGSAFDVTGLVKGIKVQGVTSGKAVPGEYTIKIAAGQIPTDAAGEVKVICKLVRTATSGAFKATEGEGIEISNVVLKNYIPAAPSVTLENDGAVTEAGEIKITSDNYASLQYKVGNGSWTDVPSAGFKNGTNKFAAGQDVYFRLKASTGKKESESTKAFKLKAVVQD